MIGSTRTQTREFTIYAMPKGRFLVELDGDEVGVGRTVVETHKLVKQHAKSDGLAGAGVTEAFGRNRQFIITPRFGYKTYKGDSHD